MNIKLSFYFLILLFIIVLVQEKNAGNQYLRINDLEEKESKDFSLWVTHSLNTDSLSVIPSILSTLLVLFPSLALIISEILKGKYQYIELIAIFNVLSHIFMILCVTTNPGIIPQIVKNRQRQVQNFIIPYPKAIDQDTKYLIPNQNLNFYLKYCYECKIFRPIRTIHCSTCNHCVQKYDHHCPWLSICIGKFNYNYFLGYICSLSCLSCYSSYACIVILVEQISQQKFFTNYLIQILVGLLSIFFAFPLMRLVLYHACIIYQNKTTNEDLKNTYDKKLQLPFKSLYCLRRNKFFDENTSYNMKKRYVRQSLQKVSNIKQIMLSSYRRQLLNDSTSSSSSVVISPHRYSTCTNERNSVLNYLIQNQHE